jgi:hypothetical protein
MTRTYDANSIAAHVGAEMTILLGVEDANNNSNVVKFDDVKISITGG